MKHLPVHPALSTADRAWLANTFAANRSRFAGWSMVDEPDAAAVAAAAAAEKAATDKAAEDAATAKAAADAAAKATGFPANTPVAEMTPAQQAAYHQHQSRKHEGRAKDWASAFPGKTAAEIKTIVDKAEADRRNTLTLDDKTLEDAKAEARKSAFAELGPKAVKSAFDLLLGDMPDKDKAEHIETLDLSKFLTDDNEVDTAKVRANVARITPDKGRGQGRDYGQGLRGATAPAGSVAAVMEARQAARALKNKTS